MKALLTLLCLSIVGISYSQSLSNEVIGSAGDYYTTSTAALSWTAGEVMTETYVGSASQLTQGFHQPLVKSSGLNEFSNLNLSVYPNPSTGVYFLDLSQTQLELEILVFDTRGRMVQQANSSGSGEEMKLDLMPLESGMYILKFVHNDSEVFAPIKIQKTL